MARAYLRSLEALRLAPNTADAAERLRSLWGKASPDDLAALLTIDQSRDLPVLTSDELRERYAGLETTGDADGAGRIALLEGLLERDSGCGAQALLAARAHAGRGDPLMRLRVTSAKALISTGDLRSSVARRALLELLCDDALEVRAAAASSLAALGGDGAMELLRARLLMGERDDRIAAICLSGLAVGDADALEFIERYLTPVHQWRLEALGALADGDAACLARLERELAELESGERRIVFGALAGAASSASFALLLRRAALPDERHAALRALRLHRVARFHAAEIAALEERQP